MEAAVLVVWVVLCGIALVSRGGQVLLVCGLVLVVFGPPALGVLAFIDQPGLGGAGYVALGFAPMAGLLALVRWEARAPITEVAVPSQAQDVVTKFEAAGYPLAAVMKTRPGIYILMFQRAGDALRVMHLTMSGRLLVTSLLAEGRGCLTTSPRWTNTSPPGELLQIVEGAALDDLVRVHLDALQLLDAQGLVAAEAMAAGPREHLELLLLIDRDALRRPLRMVVGVAFDRVTRRSFGPLAEQPDVQRRIAALRTI